MLHLDAILGQKWLKVVKNELAENRDLEKYSVF